MNYAIIGDVHSQGAELALALAYCRDNDLTPVLLGDLFDSRCETSESIYVMNLAKAAQANGAIILNSNHHTRILEAIDGEIEDEPYCSETFRTLYELGEAEVDLEAFAQWLRSMPDGFVFKDSFGVEYACAHAYFISKYRKPGATKPYTVKAENDVDESHFTWGPMDNNHRRIKWWHLPSENDFVRVCGHYHKDGIKDKTIMLDANCGFEDGRLALWDVEKRKMVYFGQPSNIIEQTYQESA
jgi:hypothetical protein